MITALLRLFHLLNLIDLLDRRGSARRPSPWTEPAPWGEHPSQLRPSSSQRRRFRSSAAPYLRALRSDIGMTTAEYAVGTVAAVAFAVVLFKVVQSPAVHGALVAVVTGALNVHL